MGFLAVLDILVQKTMPDLPWQGVSMQPAKLPYICPAGTFYQILSRSSFCMDSNGIPRSSIQCPPCPPNHYSSLADQAQCRPCRNGTIPSPDATFCISCYDSSVSDDIRCSTFIANAKQKKTRRLLSIILPIVLVFLLALALWLLFLWMKRRKERHFGLDLGEEDSWLLSYDSLTRPTLSDFMSRTPTEEKQDFLSPPNEQTAPIPESNTTQTNLTPTTAPLIRKSTSIDLDNDNSSSDVNNDELLSLATTSPLSQSRSRRDGSWDIPNTEAYTHWAIKDGREQKNRETKKATR